MYLFYFELRFEEPATRLCLWEVALVLSHPHVQAGSSDARGAPKLLNEMQLMHLPALLAL